MDRKDAKRFIDSSRFARHSDKLIAGLRESIRIHTRQSEMQRLPIGVSRIGGSPDLPAGMEWPSWMGWRMEFDQRTRKAAPTPPRKTYLDFIAQIRIRDLPVLEEALLPTQGWLCFFYDYENLPGGASSQRGGWRVLYFSCEESQLVRTEMPQANPIIGSDACEVDFSLECTLASDCVLTSCDENQDDALHELLELLNGPESTKRPCHRMLGHPDEIQNDMRVDCELASNGFQWTNLSNYQAACSDVKRLGATDWRLLLQIDSDPNPNWLWGDSGRIYFWIRNGDLRRGAFDKCWLIMQCY